MQHSQNSKDTWQCREGQYIPFSPEVSGSPGLLADIIGIQVRSRNSETEWLVVLPRGGKRRERWGVMWLSEVKKESQELRVKMRDGYERRVEVEGE